MFNRVAFVTLGLLLPWHAAIAQIADEALVMRGVISTSLLDEGRAVVVTLDRHGPSELPDGKVDEGFLLQLDPGGPNPQIPSGYGEITVKSASLAITGANGRAATFIVPGRGSAQASSAPTVTRLVGLARYPELGRVSHPEFVAQFSGLYASGSLRAPDCEPCSAGGIGSTQCSIGCFAGECSVTCVEGYYACCKCSDILPRCRCCREEGD
jgi:hypothetical protein